MTWEPIRKAAAPVGRFKLADYARSMRDFSWAKARAELDGLPGGRGLNIAHEAVDRHAAGPRAAVTALRCIARDGQVTEFSYADLRSATNRFANLLRGLGMAKGDRVFSLLGRAPELYVAASLGWSRQFLALSGMPGEFARFRESGFGAYEADTSGSDAISRLGVLRARVGALHPDGCRLGRSALNGGRGLSGG